jgi:hypothetical protein
LQIPDDYDIYRSLYQPSEKMKSEPPQALSNQIVSHASAGRYRETSDLIPVPEGIDTPQAKVKHLFSVRPEDPTPPTQDAIVKFAMDQPQVLSISPSEAEYDRWLRSVGRQVLDDVHARFSGLGYDTPEFDAETRKQIQLEERQMEILQNTVEGLSDEIADVMSPAMNHLISHYGDKYSIELTPPGEGSKSPYDLIARIEIITDDGIISLNYPHKRGVPSDDVQVFKRQADRLQVINSYDVPDRDEQLLREALQMLDLDQATVRLNELKAVEREYQRITSKPHGEEGRTQAWRRGVYLDALTSAGYKPKGDLDDEFVSATSKATGKTKIELSEDISPTHQKRVKAIVEDVLKIFPAQWVDAMKPVDQGGLLITSEESNDGRSYYDVVNRRLNVDPLLLEQDYDEAHRVILHELTHYMQDVDEDVLGGRINHTQSAFMRRVGNGDALKRTRDVTGDPYDIDEVTLPDDLDWAYAGTQNGRLVKKIVNGKEVWMLDAGEMLPVIMEMVFSHRQSLGDIDSLTWALGLLMSYAEDLG